MSPPLLLTLSFYLFHKAHLTNSYHSSEKRHSTNVKTCMQQHLPAHQPQFEERVDALQLQSPGTPKQTLLSPRFFFVPWDINECGLRVAMKENLKHAEPHMFTII